MWQPDEQVVRNTILGAVAAAEEEEVLSREKTCLT